MWFFNKKKKITGEIGFYNLRDWWLESFSEKEQKYILDRFQPLGGGDKSIIEGEIYETDTSAMKFLYMLSGWFKKKEDRHLARVILEKALSYVDDNSRILDLHFLYQHVIETYYPDREIPEFYEKAIWGCKKQIELAKQAKQAFIDEWGDESLPSHVGYKQLAIVLEKEKKYDEAIYLCKQAKYEGWSGDWDKRIERCEKKKSKQ